MPGKSCGHVVLVRFQLSGDVYQTNETDGSTPELPTIHEAT